MLIKKGGVMQCPVCKGDMWDNRGKKTNPKAPDFRCKDELCKFTYNPKSDAYEPGEFTTAVWLKKEVDAQEKQFQKSVKPQAPKQDEYVQGKEKNTRLMCRNDLMIELLKKWNDITMLKDLKDVFNDLWNEIDR